MQGNTASVRAMYGKVAMLAFYAYTCTSCCATLCQVCTSTLLFCLDQAMPQSKCMLQTQDGERPNELGQLECTLCVSDVMYVKCFAQNMNSRFSLLQLNVWVLNVMTVAQIQMQDLEHVRRCLAVEKQSNAELAESIRRQRRAAAKQEAEAAGKEHKHQDEVQELRKVR